VGLSEISESVDRYFDVHLDASYWNSLTAENRLAAVTMAVSDICAVIPGLTIDDVFYGSAVFKAISEQAVYLARNYETISEGKVVTSESVEGLSTGYSLIGGNYGIAPRAECFINQAKRQFLGNSLRIKRG
jgi:hypothetical protein